MQWQGDSKGHAMTLEWLACVTEVLAAHRSMIALGMGTRPGEQAARSQPGCAVLSQLARVPDGALVASSRCALLSILAFPEPAVADGQPLLEGEDQLGIRAPASFVAQRPDCHGHARCCVLHGVGLGGTGRLEGQENTV